MREGDQQEVPRVVWFVNVSDNFHKKLRIHNVIYIDRVPRDQMVIALLSYPHGKRRFLLLINEGFIAY